MKTRIAATLLLGACLLYPPLARADESHSLEKLVVEMAKTPADHAALAGHFKAKAADARAAAAGHEAMAKSYSGGKLADRAQMQAHCKKLADQYNAAAAEYEALAKLEEAEAKKAQ